MPSGPSRGAANLPDDGSVIDPLHPAAPTPIQRIRRSRQSSVSQAPGKAKSPVWAAHNVLPCRAAARGRGVPVSAADTLLKPVRDYGKQTVHDRVSILEIKAVFRTVVSDEDAPALTPPSDRGLGGPGRLAPRMLLGAAIWQGWEGCPPVAWRIPGSQKITVRCRWLRTGSSAFVKAATSGSSVMLLTVARISASAGRTSPVSR